MSRTGIRFQPLVDAVLASAPYGAWAHFRGITRSGSVQSRWYVRQRDGSWYTNDARDLSAPTIFYTLNPRNRPDGTAKAVIGVGALFVDVDRDVTALAVDQLASVGLPRVRSRRLGPRPSCLLPAGSTRTGGRW